MKTLPGQMAHIQRKNKSCTPKNAQLPAAMFMLLSLLDNHGMKCCSNPDCSFYEQIIYTEATRCILCRWDLKPTWQTEISSSQNASPKISPVNANPGASAAIP
jgi:hypothetical protein